MTIEQAIKILYPDTTLTALAEIEYYNGFNGRIAKVDACNEACVIVCEYIEKLQEENKKLAVLDKVQQ